MDIGKSFTYVFDDENWVQKLVIGGLLLLASVIPVVNIFTALVVLGYSLRVLKNVGEGSDRPLPDWDDWGGDWVKGLMIILAALIYSIPIWIVSGLSSAVSYFATGSAGYSSYADPGALGGMVGLCIAAMSCLSGLWGLAIGIVLPAGIIKYGMEGEFSSFFKFGEIFRYIGDNISNYIVAILLNSVAGIVASLGIILCVIGVFLTTFWSTLVGSHLFGQVQAEAAAAGAGGSAPPPPPPPPLGEVTYGDLTEADSSLGDEEESDEE